MDYTQVIIRLVLCVLIGGMIGYEREVKNMPAGFRTHILVCIGAAVVSMIQLHMIQESIEIIRNNPETANMLKADFGRMGAQVITGVGFLGAGTILHHKGSVKGLTTAATIWVTACIGLAIGMGYYTLSILSGLMVYCVVVTLKKFQNKFIL